MTPYDALDCLVDSPLMRPEDTPQGIPGIYLLHDQNNVPRYIGQTDNLRRRIWSNHCTGDLNSHKWVAVFNAGRLWHNSKSAFTVHSDGKISKKLRAAFARIYCKARILRLEDLNKQQRELLEQDVRKIAPLPMNDWNDQKALLAEEPTWQVDELIANLGLDLKKIEALSRQKARWEQSLKEY